MIQLALEIPASTTIRDLILPDDAFDEAPAKRRTRPVVSYERVVESGADSAWRRVCGSKRSLLVLLVTQNQYYIRDESRGSVRRLTPASLRSFVDDDADGTVRPAWSAEPLVEYAHATNQLLALLREDGARELIKRDRVRLSWRELMHHEARPVAFRVASAANDVDRLWRILGDIVDHDVARAVTSEVLRLSYSSRDIPRGYRDIFMHAVYVRGLAETFGVDTVRHFLRGLVAWCDTHRDIPLGDYLRVLSSLFSTLAPYDAFLPRVAFDVALRQLDTANDSERLPYHVARAWQRCVTLSRELDGEDDVILYYEDPIEEREEMEHRLACADDEQDRAIAGRAAALAHMTRTVGEFIIRPVADGRELRREARHQHNCLESYSQYAARGRTDIFLMRETAKPATSLVTIEVRDGRVRQAFGPCNRRLSSVEHAALCEWCEAVGIEQPRRDFPPLAVY